MYVGLAPARTEPAEICCGSSGDFQSGPHSPMAEAIGLTRCECGFESRGGHALIAQPAEAADSKSAQCRFEPCSAHQPSPLRGYGWQASHETAKAARRSFSQDGLPGE